MSLESKTGSILVIIAWIGIGVIIGLLICGQSCHAQAIPAVEMNDGTRLMLSSEIGTASGLGYKLPHLSFGLAIETPIKRAWEAQGALSWSPDRKYITGNGDGVLASGSVLWWPIQRIAVDGELRYSREWTSQFNKSAWTPAAGAVLRDNWFGLPGRFYAVYLFPTGCQWATAANPCAIQSNRISGIEGYQEFRMYRHWRVGIRGAWANFANQANPNDRAAGRVWNNTGTVSVVIRYEFRAGSLDVAY